MENLFYLYEGKVKIYPASFNWFDVLKDIKQFDWCFILTYNISRSLDIIRIFENFSNYIKRTYFQAKVILIANSKFKSDVRKIKKEFPEIHYYIVDNLHAKGFIFSTGDIILGSANLTHRERFAGTLDIVFYLNDIQLASFLVKNFVKPLLKISKKI